MRKIFLAALPFAACLAAACSKNLDKVIAKVGPEKITESYLRLKLEEIAPDARGYLATKPGKKQFLDVLINEKLMLLAARKSGTSSSEGYKKRIAAMETELKDKLRYYKDYILAKMWLETLREGPLKVGSAEIDDYYAKYPYEITMDYLVLPTYEEAASAMKKIKGGADFLKTAREKSMDKDNVRLPPVIYGEFIPELEEMAFKMRPGEVQGVVKTALGYHILKKAAQTKLQLPSSRDRIRRVLEKKKFDAHLAKFQAKVEVVDEDYK